MIRVDPFKKHAVLGVVRFLSSFCRPRIGYMVLCFHKIVPPDDLGLRLSPGNYISTIAFESQLRYLKRCAEYLGHDDLLTRLENKVRAEKMYFTVTFDDGYESVLSYGLPILSRLGIGATIFLATGFLDDPSAVPYWDELESFARDYHGTLKFRHNGFSGRYSLDSLKGKRIFLANSSKYILHNYDNMGKLLNELRNKVGGRAFRRNDFLSWRQVRVLRDVDVRFGSHTHTHCVMSAIDEATALEDALAGKRRIESELNVGVNSFAIPFGHPFSYTEPNIHQLAENGFHNVFTCRPGYNDQYDITSIERVSVNGFDRKRGIWGKVRYYYLTSFFRRIVASIS